MIGFPITLTSCLIISVLFNLGFSSVLIISSNSLSNSFNYCCFSFINSLLITIFFFLIFLYSLSNKRFTKCIAEFLYPFLVLLQLIEIVIEVFHLIILIVSCSKLILTFIFFSHFIPISIFFSFDSITYSLIDNFFFWISKLRLIFPKAIIFFPFAKVNILLLSFSILIFSFSNRFLVMILVDISVLIITLTSWFLILNFPYNEIIL